MRAAFGVGGLLFSPCGWSCYLFFPNPATSGAFHRSRTAALGSETCAKRTQRERAMRNSESTPAQRIRRMCLLSDEVYPVAWNNRGLPLNSTSTPTKTPQICHDVPDPSRGSERVWKEPLAKLIVTRRCSAAVTLRRLPSKAWESRDACHALLCLRATCKQRVCSSAPHPQRFVRVNLNAACRRQRRTDRHLHRPRIGRKRSRTLRESRKGDDHGDQETDG